MEIEIAPSALEEFWRATDYHAKRGLGHTFKAAVDDAIVRILANPQIHPLVAPNIRRARAGRFQYVIVYRIISDTRLRIIAIHHSHRKPNYWQRRS